MAIVTSVTKLYPPESMACCVSYAVECRSVPGLFMPKVIRSQEQIVPVGNFRSWELSFLEPFVPRSFRSHICVVVL